MTEKRLKSIRTKHKLYGRGGLDPSDVEELCAEIERLWASRAAASREPQAPPLPEANIAPQEGKGHCCCRLWRAVHYRCNCGGQWRVPDDEEPPTAGAMHCPHCGERRSLRMGDTNPAAPVDPKGPLGRLGW